MISVISILLISLGILKKKAIMNFVDLKDEFQMACFMLCSLCLHCLINFQEKNYLPNNFYLLRVTCIVDHTTRG